MPAAVNNGFEPERFASLWAGCDTGNANEAESVNKFRALRRMVAADNLRIVDVMGRADVMQALDAQLQPVREESAQLKEAFEQITQLADALAREREITADLREELSAAAVAESFARPMPARASHGGASPAQAYVGGLFAFLFVLGLLHDLFALAWRLVAAALGG